MHRTYTLGGRAFVKLEVTTLGQDLRLTQLLVLKGLSDPGISEGESPEDYGWRMIRQMVDAGVVLAALSHLIIPAEAAPRSARHGLLKLLEDWGFLQPARHCGGWTPDLAAETEYFLGELDDPRDKEAVFGLVAEMLFPFCVSGLRSWASSLSSLQAAVAAARESVENPVPASVAMAGGEA